MTAILLIVILVVSVILHELSHGYMADFLGDPTARLQGRLTLNPLSHIDPIGSIVVPLVTYALGGFAFGWAKPVPYNPYNLKDKRRGEFLIALAGPASNLLIALVFGTVLRFTAMDAGTPFITAVSYIVIVNIILAIFNLIPLPPLDGSKILFSFLPSQYGRFRQALESAGPVWIIVIVFFLWEFVYPLIPLVFRWFTGFGL